jgi:hypothetical protein
MTQVAKPSVKYSRFVERFQMSSPPVVACDTSPVAGSVCSLPVGRPTWAGIWLASGANLLEMANCPADGGGGGAVGRVSGRDGVAVPAG